MAPTLRDRLDTTIRRLVLAPSDPVRTLALSGLMHPALLERVLPPVSGAEAWTAAAAVPSVQRPNTMSREPLSFQLVAFGCKPMMLEHGPAGEMADLAQHATARNFTALLAPYTFEPDRDLKRNGYSNIMRDGSSWRGLLVSAEPRTVLLGWLALAAGWDRLLGRLLGYPPCCADAFAVNWPSDRLHWRGDPASRLLSAPRDPTQPLPWHSNVFARFQAPCLIEHFPCRFDCPETIALSRRHERCLDAMAPAASRAARATMRSVVYEDENGIDVVPGAELVAGAVAWPATAMPGGLTGLRARLAGLRVAPDGLWRNGARVSGRFAAFTADPAEVAE